MFTIDQAKLDDVTRIYNEKAAEAATSDQLLETITYDWSNADEHQEWLDTASADEIASWLMFGSHG